MSGKEARIERYAAAYLADYGFESVQVRARRRTVIDVLQRFCPTRVVEVGTGADPLVAHIPVEFKIGRWVVVEPNHEFATRAKEACRDSIMLHVIEGFVEDSVAGVLEACSGPPDLVICSSLLHEVERPAALLHAFMQLLSPRAGVLHVNVPNAGSMHRRLGRSMHILEHENDKSRRNRDLEQYRVYDKASLHSELQEAGFIIESHGGYFLKPFSHAQMATLAFLTPEVLDGLWVLGAELPDLASEIYANARVGP